MYELKCSFCKLDFTLIFIAFHLGFIESQSIWTREPQAVIQVEIGSNAVLEWDYDLNGQALFFAKWGKLRNDRSWDKSYIMRGKGDSRAEAVAMFASKVQWIANATMVIMNVSLSDAGQYGCLIDLSNGESMESFIKLEVLQLIKVNQSGSQLLKPSEGSQFSLHFDTFANYQPKVLWFKDGVQLKQNSSFNYTVEVISNQSNQMLYRFTLHKQAADRNDSGFYQGFVEFVKKHVIIRNFTLLVKYSPQNSTNFYTSTGSNILLEGSNASLICSADSYPAPNYEIRTSTTSLSNSTVGYHGFYRVSTMNEGVYFCTPRNEVGQGKTESINVQIGNAPSISSLPVTNYVVYGNNITMRCTIHAWPLPSLIWFKDGGSLRAGHKIRNITNGKHIVGELEISKADLSDIGNYSCIAENMFGRRHKYFSLEVIMLVFPNISLQKDFVFTEGSNFSISYDVPANRHPNVLWFKDGQNILHGFNMTVEIAGTEGNLTIYRIALYKNALGSDNNGVYYMMLTFGTIQFNLTSFTIKVEALQASSQKYQDDEFETWMIPLVIGIAALLLLAVAIFCGVVNGHRLRTSDPENNARSTPGADKSSMRTDKRQSVKNRRGNGISNVAFEGENEDRKETRKDGDAEENNHEFNRDSIYRFTVNPMFSSPEEENRGDIDDQYLPFRNSMYLPTDTSFETSEVEITFDDEDDIEENYLSSPPNIEEDMLGERITHSGEESSSIAPDERVLEPSGVSEEEAPELEVDQIEAEATVPEETTEEDVTGREDRALEIQEEEIGTGLDITDHGSEDSLNESSMVPHISEANKFKETTPSFEMYISDMFDFRTSIS